MKPEKKAIEITYSTRKSVDETRGDARARGVPNHATGRVVDQRMTGHTIIRWEWTE